MSGAQHTPQVAPAITAQQGAHLARACGCGAAAGPEAKCPACKAESALGAPSDVRLGGVDTALEHEADRVADQVMGQTEPRALGPASPTAVQRSTQKEENLQRAPSGSALSQVPSLTPTQTAAQAVQSGGRALSSSEQGFFEPLFGRALGSVRLHTHQTAQRAAERINARAYTLGQNIAFGPGQYAPSTRAGQHLMAHELTHTLQQSSGGAPSSVAALEAEAEQGATQALQGHAPVLQRKLAAGTIARFGKPQHVPDKTYVATPGSDSFLKSANAYHKNWGLKPQSVSSMEDLVAKLAGGTGAITRMRLISHADHDNIYIKMFKNSSNGIAESQLRAFGESQAEGLASHLPTALISEELQDAVVDRVRGDDASVLKPFGLESAKRTASGLTRTLVQRTLEHWMYETVGANPKLKGPGKARVQDAKKTMTAALQVILTQTKGQAQKPVPDGLGVTMDEVDKLINALRAMAAQGLQFDDGLDPVDSQLLKDLKAGMEGASPKFYENLGKARARFGTDSTIDLRGCRVGGAPSYMKAVSAFFGSAGSGPTVTGPDWWQHFPKLSFDAFKESGLKSKAADPDISSSLHHWMDEVGLDDTFSNDEDRLAAYLKMPMVLPVQLAATGPEAFTFLALAPLKKAAMDAWLTGVWASKAPQLKAMQKAGMGTGKARQVESVINKNPATKQVTEMFISPDSDYASHIKST